jgi:hypothetical protein
MVNNILKQRSVIETSMEMGQQMINQTKLDQTKRLSYNSNEEAASEEQKENDLFFMDDD